jgi:hypothetical protein
VEQVVAIEVEAFQTFSKISAPMYNVEAKETY